MTIGRLLLGAAIVGTVVTGGVAVDAAAAPEARAAACWGQITQTQGKNYTGCGVAQHFDRLTNGQIKLGNRAASNSWSRQPMCWAGIAQYGMIRA